MKIRRDGFWSFLFGNEKAVLRARITKLEGSILDDCREQEAAIIASIEKNATFAREFDGRLSREMQMAERLLAEAVELRKQDDLHRAVIRSLSNQVKVMEQQKEVQQLENLFNKSLDTP